MPLQRLIQGVSTSLSLKNVDYELLREFREEHEYNTLHM